MRVGGTRRARALARAALLVAGMALVGCTPYVDVWLLGTQSSGGRNNGTPESARARDIILATLRKVSVGAVEGETGDDAFLQPFPGGTNVVGIMPGTDLADEYVVVGAHYDGIGTSCPTSVPGDNVCNGATDNATGVAAVLEIARRLDLAPVPPRRSVVFALWDREEDGLLGSRYYTNDDPLVPLEDTVAYVNFDIQGANLLPSLRSTTFAIGAETGGDRFVEIVTDGAAPQDLDTRLFSAVFGLARSDYVNFVNVQVPTVFFSDSTGPCYHTAQDSPHIVDFPKLNEQIDTAFAVTNELANTDELPSFVANRPLATWDDLLTFSHVIDQAMVDIDRFSPAAQATITSIDTTIDAIIAAGEAEFGNDDLITMLLNAETAVNLLREGECDGFLADPE